MPGRAGSATEGIVHHHDYLATVLHLFGLQQDKLVYKRNGRAETLLNGQPGRVVNELLA